MENSKGWVEVIVGEDTKRDRLSNWLVVPFPSRYSIGDVCPDDIFVNSECNTSQPSSKDKDTPSSSNAEKKIRLNLANVFYWYCSPCDCYNAFVETKCKNCRKDRKIGHYGTPSALLEIVENLCIVDNTTADVIKDIPAINRQSIPRQVVSYVQASRGTEAKDLKPIDIHSHLGLETLFYWQCQHCTMENSFRLWSCKTCKRKVSFP